MIYDLNRFDDDFTLFQSINYSENFLKIDNLINNLEEQTDIIKDVDSWHREYKVQRKNAAGHWSYS